MAKRDQSSFKLKKNPIQTKHENNLKEDNFFLARKENYNLVQKHLSTRICTRMNIFQKINTACFSFLRKTESPQGKTLRKRFWWWRLWGTGGGIPDPETKKNLLSWDGFLNYEFLSSLFIISSSKGQLKEMKRTHRFVFFSIRLILKN